MSEKEKMNTQNKKEISGFLKGVEIIGNKLPHPAMLFLLLAVIVVHHIPFCCCPRRLRHLF